MVFDKLFQRIADFRRASDMTQTELAKKLGVTRSAVNAWEMGLSTPQLKHVVMMAEIFNTTVDGLLDTGDRTIVDISALNIQEQETIINMISCLKNNHTKKTSK